MSTTISREEAHECLVKVLQYLETNYRHLSTYNDYVLSLNTILLVIAVPDDGTDVQVPSGDDEITAADNKPIEPSILDDHDPDNASHNDWLLSTSEGPDNTEGKIEEMIIKAEQTTGKKHPEYWACGKCSKVYVDKTYYELHLEVHDPPEKPPESVRTTRFSKRCAGEDLPQKSRTARKSLRTVKKKGHATTDEKDGDYTPVIVKRERKSDVKYTCEKCDKGYAHEGHYENHVRFCGMIDAAAVSDLLENDPNLEESREKQVEYYCDVCDHTYVNQKWYRRHLRRSHHLRNLKEKKDGIDQLSNATDAADDGNRTCDKCGKSYTFKGSYLKHIAECGEPVHFGNTAQQPEEEDKEEDWKKKTKFFECEICQTKILTKKHFKRHQKSMKHLTNLKCGGTSVIKRRTCPKCKRTLSTREQFRRHMVRGDCSPLLYKCLPCQKIYKALVGICDHVKQRHEGPVLIQCMFCQVDFNSSEDLRDHAKHDFNHVNHENEFKHVCEICGHRCASRHSLKRHSETHMDTKDFKCEECGKAFKSKVYLKAHQKTHENIRPHACPHCGQKFAQRSKMRIHMRMHTGERPYTCEVCGKTFIRLAPLKVHQRTHTGERPFRCDICGKTFADPQSHRLHALLHTGEKPFQCELCGKYFRKRYTLTMHKKTHSKDGAMVVSLPNNVKKATSTASTNQNQPLKQEFCVDPQIEGALNELPRAVEEILQASNVVEIPHYPSHETDSNVILSSGVPTSYMEAHLVPPQVDTPAVVNEVIMAGSDIDISTTGAVGQVHVANIDDSYIHYVVQ